MTPERWQREKEIFSQVRSAAAADRPRLLDELCGRDAELRGDLEKLLAGHDSAGAFLDDGAGAFLPEPEELRPGQVLAGRFELLRLAGEGGMGQVWAVQDRLGNETVAVKTIHHRIAADPAAVERFKRELQLARRIAHPNVCKLYDLFEDEEGRLFLTMELLEGETLASRLKREGRAVPAEAMELMRQLLAGLEAAHAAGVTHRDLKPDNILLATDRAGRERAVIMDFGLARANAALAMGAAVAGPVQTESGLVIGTPEYMAPEQIRAEASTPATDLYALGLIFYEMLRGERPFAGRNTLDAWMRRVREGPPKLTGQVPDLPSRADAFIARCAEYDPAARFATAAEAWQALGGERRGWSGRMIQAGMAAAIAAALVAAVLIAAARPPWFDASMVVFQIDGLGGDPSAKQLAGGLTAELVSRLAAVDGLAVKPYYRTRQQAPVAALLDRFQLDGDLRRHGDRLRLSMRLIDASMGSSVAWSRTFERDLHSPLEFETEVADGVVAGLGKRVFGEAPGQVRLQYLAYRARESVQRWFGLGHGSGAAVTRSPSAYLAYVRSRQLLVDRTPAAVQEAVRSLEQAIRDDPEFALAHAALSDASRALIDGRLGPQSLIHKAREHADRAIVLGPKLPEAHAALAAVRQMQWDWEGSEASYREAIRLDPRSPAAYRRYGGLVLQFGRFDEALAHMRKGLELDPYDYPSQAAYGYALLAARRYAEAEKHLKWTLAQREIMSAHNTLGSLYAVRGRDARDAGEARRFFELALAEAESVRGYETRAGGDRTPVSDYMFAMFHALRGDRDIARRHLARLTARADIDELSPASLALIYSALGDKELASKQILQAGRVRDRGLLYIKVHPIWDLVRGTEGYRQVTGAMRL